MGEVRAMSLRDPPAVAGRLPPHDLEAEAAVLSTCLLKRGVVDELAFLAPEHFYNPANRRVFEVVLELSRSCRPVDVVQVAGLLRDREQLAAIGGPAYLAQVVDATPAVHNVVEHAKRVEAKARVRRIISEAQAIAAEGYGDIGEELEWVAEAEARLAKLAEGAHRRELVTIGEALRRAWTKVQAEADGKIAGHGGRFGIEGLDHLLGFLRPKRVTVIGGFWGDGKSALGLQVALASVEQAPGPDGRRPAAVVLSVEMEDEELAQRALFMRARVDSSKARPDRQRELTPTDWRALNDGIVQVGKMPLWIDDSEDLSTAAIGATVRRHKAAASRIGCELRVVVVDYLQLIDGRTGLQKGANRENEIANVARTLKRVAKAEGVHVVALAQLNDDANKAGKEARKPRARDFRESKAIPMNADNVVLIHNANARQRAQQYWSGERARVNGQQSETVEFIVDKHRGGPTGTVKALFYPALTLFTDHDGREDD